MLINGQTPSETPIKRTYKMEIHQQLRVEEFWLIRIRKAETSFIGNALFFTRPNAIFSKFNFTMSNSFVLIIE
jgi:hypothetical protein